MSDLYEESRRERERRAREIQRLREERRMRLANELKTKRLETSDIERLERPISELEYQLDSERGLEQEIAKAIREGN